MNPDMIAETIASNGANLARDHKKESQTRKRNLGLPKESPKQKEIRERLKFYRAVWMDVQKKTQGFCSCAYCGEAFDPDQLDLHHIDRRARGGLHHFSNLAFACRGPGTNDCHRREDGNLLQWSDGRES